MKALILSICLVLSVPVWAQKPEVQLPAATASGLEKQPSPDTNPQNYASRAVLLLSGQKGVEGVMPMIFVVNGKNRLTFVPGSHIKESIDSGGQPIHLGDILSALGDATQTIDRLQAENDSLKAANEKLWKVALKDSPQEAPPPTVIVQQPAPPPQPTAQEVKRMRRQEMIRTWLMMQSANPQRPYQLPMPVNPNANRLQTNCTTSHIGAYSYTNCN